MHGGLQGSIAITPATRILLMFSIHSRGQIPNFQNKTSSNGLRKIVQPASRSRSAIWRVGVLSPINAETHVRCRLWWVGRDVHTLWGKRTQPRPIGLIWHNRHRYGMTYKMLHHLHRRQALQSSAGTPMFNVRGCGAFDKIRPRIPGPAAPGVSASNGT